METEDLVRAAVGVTGAHSARTPRSVPLHPARRRNLWIRALTLTSTVVHDISTVLGCPLRFDSLRGLKPDNRRHAIPRHS